MNHYEHPDVQYEQLVRNIFVHGSTGQTRTGTMARKLFGWDFKFDLGEMFPIITKKRMFFETAKKELFWIYVDQSNDVRLLRNKYNVKIWDEWELKKTKVRFKKQFPFVSIQRKGTIGKAYGYQIRKHKQMDKLLDGLHNDPQGRRHVMTMWGLGDLEDMSLMPCAFQTIWDVDPNTGKLNMQLVQRSGDVGLGVPFNMTQYAILQHMVAHVLGLEVGVFWHCITNPHLYVDHLEPITKIFDRHIIPCEPKIRFTRQVTDWYDFKPEDIVLEDYTGHAHIPMEVSV